MSSFIISCVSLSVQDEYCPVIQMDVTSFKAERHANPYGIVAHHNMADESGEAARWIIGPPAPFFVSVVTRLLELATLLITVIWVFHNLGGLGFQPRTVLGPKPGIAANDTAPIFNWHPLLMSLAFPVFMAEAILAYKVPLAKELDKSQRKILHAALHTAALFCVILAIIAAFKSHTLKKPVPVPNLYSPHSYLGMLTFVLTLAQYLVGLGGFFLSRVPSKQRAALAPLHVFLGRATFTLGLATMAVGIQEKTTFMQDGMKLQGSALYRSYLKLPATIQLLLALTGLFVLYHHAPTAAKRPVTDHGLLDEELAEPDI